MLSFQLMFKYNECPYRQKTALAQNSCPFQSPHLIKQATCLHLQGGVNQENQVYFDATVLANCKIKSFPFPEQAWEGCGFSKEIIQSLRDVNIFMVLIINEVREKKGMTIYFF